MSAREAVGEEAGVLIELVWFRDRADLVSRLRGCHLELGAGVAARGVLRGGGFRGVGGGVPVGGGGGGGGGGGRQLGGGH